MPSISGSKPPRCRHHIEIVPEPEKIESIDLFDDIAAIDQQLELIHERLRKEKLPPKEMKDIQNQLAGWYRLKSSLVDHARKMAAAEVNFLEAGQVAYLIERLYQSVYIWLSKADHGARYAGQVLTPAAVQNHINLDWIKELMDKRDMPLPRNLTAKRIIGGKRWPPKPKMVQIQEVDYLLERIYEQISWTPQMPDKIKQDLLSWIATRKAELGFGSEGIGIEQRNSA